MTRFYTAGYQPNRDRPTSSEDTIEVSSKLLNARKEKKGRKEKRIPQCLPKEPDFLDQYCPEIPFYATFVAPLEGF